MKKPEGMGRRELLATLAKWSGAALSIAGLESLATGCAVNRSKASGPSGTAPSGAPANAVADNANYFDYSNYANYINGPGSTYGDYANYSNYSNYYDHVDAYGDSYSEAYGDAYLDSYSESYTDTYADSGNYANYSDYSDYSEYTDYSDNYSDAYTDASDVAASGRRRPAGAYGDYADVYADAGSLPARGGSPEPVKGRAQVTHHPFRGAGRHLVADGTEATHGPAWLEEPQARLRPGGPLGSEAEGPDARQGARQGREEELQRPERQKPGLRSRTLAGPSNRPGGTRGGTGTGR